MIYIFLYFIIVGIIPALYYAFFIVSAVKQDGAIIQNKSFLLVYGILGLVHTAIRIVFSYSVVFSLLDLGIFMTGVIFLIIFSKRNSYLYGNFLFIASILFISNIAFSFLSVIFLRASELLYTVYNIIRDLLWLSGLLFVTLHGYKNKDNYILAAGAIYLVGGFIFNTIDITRVYLQYYVDFYESVYFIIEIIIYVILILVGAIYMIVKRKQRGMKKLDTESAQIFRPQASSINREQSVSFKGSGPSQNNNISSDTSEMMYCPNCGSKLTDKEQKFCQHCGTGL
jgi:hypothetical protein